MSEWKPEPELRQTLFDAVPEILESQRADGRFGTEPWICRDQQMTFPLAAAWSLQDSPRENSQYSDTPRHVALLCGDCVLQGGLEVPSS